ncbi:hypothetical protein GCM10011613_35910 [Cellvibrio zantedeschiae]|uniref:DUF4870 domain-containing protein n=1 Tax=Cellvibrio zantedeschiae TaxID=1237077 RepID=A0ABQ3BAR6_9GAMM|nr:hypothetical protein [Cellvibrio zantedeschiae]GGY87719.1 hypothetical protein GCM10011613_35910 [Cellvibrio zantedeschiae]
MDSILYSIFAFIGVAAFCSPAPIVLAFIYLGKSKKGKQKVQSEVTKAPDKKFDLAITYFIVSSAISPLIPIIFLFKWYGTVGSASGVPLIFIIPLAWLFFFMGLYNLISSGIKKIPIDNNP